MVAEVAGKLQPKSVAERSHALWDRGLTDNAFLPKVKVFMAQLYLVSMDKGFKLKVKVNNFHDEVQILCCY